MFYSILRQLVATALKIYFRKIYLLGSKNVPKDAPLIIAANHPMAFCDACLLACFLNRPLHFLVRGDVFVKRWRWFFDWTNQIPIYRFRDGFGNMRKNANTFAHVHEKLKQRAAVLIFAEGDTKLRKHLGTLQKGPVRIAIGALQAGASDDLQILPVGINYTDGDRFRSDVFLSIGQGISLRDHQFDSVEKKKNVVAAVTENLYTALLPHVIHCEDDLREEVHRTVTAQQPIDCRWPILDESTDRFQNEKRLANQLNDKSNDEIKVMLSTVPEKRKPGFFRVLVTCILMPLIVSGLILNAVPFYLAKKISENRVKLIEFYTPVRIGLTMILELFWLLIVLIVGWLAIGPTALLVVAMIPFMGYLAIILLEQVKM